MHINPTELWESEADTQLPLGEENARQSLPRRRENRSCFLFSASQSHFTVTQHDALAKQHGSLAGKAFLAVYEKEGTCVRQQSGLFSVQQIRVQVTSATCRPPNPGDGESGGGSLKGPGDTARRAGAGAQQPQVGGASGQLRDRQEGTRRTERGVAAELVRGISENERLPTWRYSSPTFQQFPRFGLSCPSLFLPTLRLEGLPSGDSDPGLTATRPSSERQVMK